MINLPPLHSTKRIDAKIIPVVLKTWQIGQILESRAKTSSNAAGELQIQLGQHIFDAKTKSPIAAGEELRLQVAKLGDTPLLKILNKPVATDPITLFLRQAIPQNNSIQKLLNLITHTHQLVPDSATTPSAKTPAKTTESQPLINTLTKQLASLLQLPLKANEVSSKPVQQFLQQSGINFEHQLLAQGIPSKNLKLNLIELQQTVNQLIKHSEHSNISQNPQAIKQTLPTQPLASIAGFLLFSIPPADKNTIISYLSNSQGFDINKLNDFQTSLIQVLRKFSPAQVKQLNQWIQFIPVLAEMRQLVEQSINTINNHQLQALQADADSAFLLLFNLLVAKNPDWIDLFNISINKEEKDELEKDHWRVTIQMDIPQLGLMEAQLTLVKKQMHVSVSSQSVITHQLIQEHLTILENALSQAGFDVATISCKQQTIEPLAHRQKTHGPLLDDKA